jgi:hypothetical protein
MELNTENACPKCSRPQTAEEMWIIDGKCWKCKGDVKVATIRSNSLKRGGTTTGPEAFTTEEIALAKSKGVMISQVHSYTMGESYLANTCSCGTFIGQFYLFTDYFQLADLGEYKSERLTVGFSCFDCEEKEDALY